MKHAKSQVIIFDQNLAYQALRLIRATYAKKISQQGPKKFIHITIKKNIPVSSGLGGASSDAAAVLKGLNTFWNLKIPTRKLLALAARLGMDVPFFIIGGTALGTHFGEKITPLPPLKNIKFKIFAKSANSQSFFSKQLNRSSTKSAGHAQQISQSKTKSAHPPRSAPSKTALSYSSLDLSLCGKNTAKTKALIKILKQSKIKIKGKKRFPDSKSPVPNDDLLSRRFIPLLHNDFETLPAYKNLPKNHHLSGSGPTTFAAKACP